MENENSLTNKCPSSISFVKSYRNCLRTIKCATRNAGKASHFHLGLPSMALVQGQIILKEPGMYSLMDCYQISSRGATVFCTPRNVRRIILVSCLILLFFVFFVLDGICHGENVLLLLFMNCWLSIGRLWCTMLEISENLRQECMYVFAKSLKL